MNLIEYIGHDEKPWLDNKQEFHRNNVELLHDILCLTNVRHDGDRYLVFGVESDNRTVCGVENDQNNKDNAAIQDLLRQSNLNRIPTVELECRDINGHEVAILVISNRPDKPFFLLKDKTFQGKTIRAGVVYTRLGDTNTPLGECAPEADEELMWRERFGIGLQPLKRVERLLDEPEKWKAFDEGCFYHEEFPEFTIVTGEDYMGPFEEEWVRRFLDPHASSYNVEVKYHTTILKNVAFIRCDGTRYHFPLPHLRADGVPEVDVTTMEWKITALFPQYMNLEQGLTTHGVVLLNQD